MKQNIIMLELSFSLQLTHTNTDYVAPLKHSITGVLPLLQILLNLFYMTKDLIKKVNNCQMQYLFSFFKINNMFLGQNDLINLSVMNQGYSVATQKKFCCAWLLIIIVFKIRDFFFCYFEKLKQNIIIINLPHNKIALLIKDTFIQILQISQAKQLQKNCSLAAKKMQNLNTIRFIFFNF